MPGLPPHTPHHRQFSNFKRERTLCARVNSVAVETGKLIRRSTYKLQLAKILPNLHIRWGGKNITAQANRQSGACLTARAVFIQQPSRPLPRPAAVEHVPLAWPPRGPRDTCRQAAATVQKGPPFLYPTPRRPAARRRLASRDLAPAPPTGRSLRARRATAAPVHVKPRVTGGCSRRVPAAGLAEAGAAPAPCLAESRAGQRGRGLAGAPTGRGRGAPVSVAATHATAVLGVASGPSGLLPSPHDGTISGTGLGSCFLRDQSWLEWLRGPGCLINLLGHALRDSEVLCSSLVS